MLINNASRKFYLLCSSSKVHIIFLIIISSIILFWNLGENSLRHLDEAIFAQISKEVITTGDWITLHIRGELFHRPPLGIWFNSLAFILFGVNELAARFWSAIFGSGTILVVYFLAKKIYNKKTALLSSLILLFSNQFLFERFSRSAQDDAMVVFFICLSLYFFWLSREKKTYIYLSSILIGFTFMANSTIALFPILVILFFIITTKEFKLYNLKTWIISLFIIMIIVLPWHILQLLISGENFLKIYPAELIYFLNPSLLMSKNFLTNFITSGVIDRIGQGDQVAPFLNIWYYLYVILIGFFPWSIILPFAVLYGFKPIIKNNSFTENNKKANVLILCWFFVPLILFSLLHIKRTWRINPIYPAMSIFIANFFVRSLNKKNNSIHLATIILISAFIINLSPNQFGSPHYTFCSWLEYFLNFSLLNIPQKSILSFNNTHPKLGIILAIILLFIIYIINKNKLFIKKVISGCLLGYLLVISATNCLYLVSKSNYKSDMHIISKRIGEISKTSYKDLIVWEDSLIRMQFGRLRPEFPSPNDNWADFYYLNNIKNIKLHFVQEYEYLHDEIIGKQKNNILVLINKDNLAKIRDSIKDREISILIIKGKFVVLDIPPRQL